MLCISEKKAVREPIKFIDVQENTAANHYYYWNCVFFSIYLANRSRLLNCACPWRSILQLSTVPSHSFTKWNRCTSFWLSSQGMENSYRHPLRVWAECLCYHNGGVCILEVEVIWAMTLLSLNVCYIELSVMRSVHKDTIVPCSLLSSDGIISCY